MPTLREGRSSRAGAGANLTRLCGLMWLALRRSFGSCPLAKPPGVVCLDYTTVSLILVRIFCHNDNLSLDGAISRIWARPLTARSFSNGTAARGALTTWARRAEHETALFGSPVQLRGGCTHRSRRRFRARNLPRCRTPRGGSSTRRCASRACNGYRARARPACCRRCRS